MISANLNYWAYWVGESSATWNTDSAMTRPAASTWDGTSLLETLLRGIVHAPYRDLCAHTLWALLLLRRPQLTSPREAPRDQGGGVPCASDGSLVILRSPAPRTSQLSHNERMTTPGNAD